MSPGAVPPGPVVAVFAGALPAGALPAGAAGFAGAFGPVTGAGAAAGRPGPGVLREPRRLARRADHRAASQPP